EIQEAARVVTETTDPKATILWGHVLDPELDEKVQITVIATGFASGPGPRRALSIPRKSGGPFIETEALARGDVSRQTTKDPVPPLENMEDLDTPPEIRRRKYGHKF
ncbi:MAG TPA: cell division protein FtsZ, partial [Synergistales bacterium]|nr:cell division protein FtsZ [Synergistales bacterium]